MLPTPPCSPLFPYTTLFRSSEPFTSVAVSQGGKVIYDQSATKERAIQTPVTVKRGYLPAHRDALKRLLMANMERSEEHTSELQSPVHLVCRLLLEKKKKKNI